MTYSGDEDTLAATHLQCSRCPFPALLVVRINEREWLCSRCWKAAGEPGYTGPVRSITAVHEAEEKIRASMQARGGEDRYRVISGKSWRLTSVR